jgi:hypothetical protein
MDATVLLAALFFCLPCSPLEQQAGEPITTTPATQSIFIEVYPAEPIAVEKAQDPTSTTPAIVDGPSIDSSAESDEPIEHDAAPEDPIEPMFAEDIEATKDDEPVPAETAPVDVVPSVIVEDATVSKDDPTSAPPTTAIEESTNNEIVNDLSAEIAEPIDHNPALLDAGEPIADENVTGMLEPHPEPVDLPVSDAPTTITDIAAPQIVEPDCLPVAEEFTVPVEGVVAETISSPKSDFDEPASEPVETVEPAIIEGAFDVSGE